MALTKGTVTRDIDLSNESIAENRITGKPNVRQIFRNALSQLIGAVALVDAQGNHIPTFDRLEIAKGNVAGHSIVNKFGLNPTVENSADGEIINTLGTVGFASLMPSVATVASIISTSAEDAPGGDNVSSVFLEGVDANWDLLSESVELNGDVGAVTSLGLFLRIFRIQGDAQGAGAVRGNSNAGVITASTGGTPQINIPVGVGRSLSATYAVPRGHSFYLDRAYASVLKATSAQTTALDLHIHSVGDDGIEKMRAEVGAQNDGSTYIDHEFSDPEKFAEKSDVFLEAHVSTNNSEVSGGFSGILVQDGF